MIIRGFCFGLATALALALPAAAATPYDGDWEGVLHAGARNLRLELHVKSEGDNTTAVLESLDQGISAPSSAVKIENGQIQVLYMTLMGELKGKLAPDGKTLEASWTQGVTLPLTLSRKAAK